MYAPGGSLNSDLLKTFYRAGQGRGKVTLVADHVNLSLLIIFQQQKTPTHKIYDQAKIYDRPPTGPKRAAGRAAMLASVPDYNAQQPDQSKTPNGKVQFHHFRHQVSTILLLVVAMVVAACCGFFITASRVCFHAYNNN